MDSGRKASRERKRSLPPCGLKPKPDACFELRKESPAEPGFLSERLLELVGVAKADQVGRAVFECAVEYTLGWPCHHFAIRDNHQGVREIEGPVVLMVAGTDAEHV